MKKMFSWLKRLNWNKSGDITRLYVLELKVDVISDDLKKLFDKTDKNVLLLPNPSMDEGARITKIQI